MQFLMEKLTTLDQWIMFVAERRLVKVLITFHTLFNKRRINFLYCCNHEKLNLKPSNGGNSVIAIKQKSLTAKENGVLSTT